MTLYLPSAFGAPDREAVAALLRAHPFATLVTPPVEGEPCISHLPLLWDGRAGAHGELIGHLAAANPHAQVLTSADSIAIFHGPHAYVSPAWYTQPATMVPTWNYAAVHVHGRAVWLDEAGKLDCIDRLTAQFEHARAQPWQRAPDGDSLAAKLRGIVAFRLPIARIEAKFKMSQNRSTDDRLGVIRGLRAEGGTDGAGVADWMQAHEPN